MAQDYGIQVPGTARPGAPPQEAVRYLLLIDSAAQGGRIARLFLASRVLAGEFDAAAPEVLAMIDGLIAQRGARGPEWDQALAGHSADERKQADIYELDI